MNTLFKYLSAVAVMTLALSCGGSVSENTEESLAPFKTESGEYSFTVGGAAVTPEVKTNKDGVTYLVVRLAAYRMLDTVEYAIADTEISGEYNLSAYLEFAASDPALENLVLRLMKYAESAEVYRVANSD